MVILEGAKLWILICDVGRRRGRPARGPVARSKQITATCGVIEVSMLPALHEVTA
jgi:hypothetical protein